MFMNNLLRGKQTQSQSETSNTDFYGILNVDEPDIATNSASIIVSGDATEFEDIEFYINNVKVDTAKVKSNGTFSQEIGKLRSGTNKVYVLASTKDGKNEKQSESYSVTFMNEPPELEIESPHEGDKTSKNEIQVKGKTAKDVSVHINNQPVVVGFEGSFSRTVRLNEGENTITIIATDIAGNTEEQQIKVIYEKDE